MRDLNPKTAVHADKIPPLSTFAQSTIEALDLAAHPEGGWYKRTWQSPLEYADTSRPLASLIYFLLPEGDYSDWHLVDADELWLWHGPGAVEIEVCDEDPRSLDAATYAKHSTRSTLKIDAEHPKDTCAQFLVKAGQWQRTLPGTSDALVSCVVSPGFTFEGFTVIDAD
ncbi:cupin domain-containing protein [Alloscardovia criceti]|uniref:cupin domain-containing protein n=1 Tax=Alloscardovia criceti TaxID=356828 RepID=UPI00035E23A5|nr:cupin domain-containing protein [Alloscardovia criceti]